MQGLSPLSYLEVIARTGSIRKAAEVLSITSTALNRRLLALEQRLGSPLFERLPRGVRPSAAGEIVLEHVRKQISDIERMTTQIADLQGARRGHIAVACSQAFLPYFLPRQIARFRASHPGVTFTVLRREREAAEQSLLDQTADIAMVVEPISLSVMNAVARIRQPVHALMRIGHPLASQETVSLSDCLRYPTGLPTTAHGVRQLIDLALAQRREPYAAAVESDSFDFLRNYDAEADMITFQIPIGLPDEADGGMTHRPIRIGGPRPAEAIIGHLRGRSLPGVAASFLDQITFALTQAPVDG